MQWKAEWEAFCERWKIDEEIQKIDNWMDWRIYALDFSLFVHSCNEKKEQHSTSSSNKDKQLDMLVKYDELKEDFLDFDEAVNSLNIEEKRDFQNLFIEKRKNYKTNILFLKETLIVKLASLDRDYIFNEIIESEYDCLKKSYFTWLDFMIDEKKRKLETFIFLYSNLIKVNWSKESLLHCHGNYNQKLFILGILRYQKILNDDDFKNLAYSMRAGKSYYAFLKQQL